MYRSEYANVTLRRSSRHCGTHCVATREQPPALRCVCHSARRATWLGSTAWSAVQCLAVARTMAAIRGCCMRCATVLQILAAMEAAHCLAAVRRHTSPAPVHRNAVHSTNSSVKCANAAAAAYALRAAHSRSAQHAVRRGALYDRLAREPQPAARPSTAVPPPHQSQVCLTVSQTFGNCRCAGGHC